MAKRLQKIEWEIATIQKALKKQPPGELYCAKSGDYYKWYVKQEQGRIYLPKKEKPLAEELAAKKYLKAELSDLNCEKKASELYLKQRNRSRGTSSALLDESSRYRSLLSSHFKTTSDELREWESASFNSNPYRPENLIHKTFSGRIVRSKSEVIIDNALSLKNIPFRYEAELMLDDGPVYPDFTVRHPQTGKTMYWEHFGMIDDAEYALGSSDKLLRFYQNGILPSINLIVTFETREKPLSVETVQEIISLYFGS